MVSRQVSQQRDRLRDLYDSAAYLFDTFGDDLTGVSTDWLEMILREVQAYLAQEASVSLGLSQFTACFLPGESTCSRALIIASDKLWACLVSLRVMTVEDFKAFGDVLEALLKNRKRKRKRKSKWQS